jgi:hypothetical protein
MKLIAFLQDVSLKMEIIDNSGNKVIGQVFGGKLSARIKRPLQKGNTDQNRKENNNELNFVYDTVCETHSATG